MLTRNMIKIVEKQRLGFVATVCGDGSPSLSPKGTFVVIDGWTIAFGDIRSPGSIANLRQNPRVEVNFVDPILRRGLRAKGTAKIMEQDSPEFPRLRPHFDRWGALAERISRIVVIAIETAKPLTTPAYDDGVSEEELRENWTAVLTSAYE